ncbi:MAG: metallophosphoesterase [Pseudomonadota bacterium]
MQKLLFLTDLHICAPGERIIGLDPSARTAAALYAAVSTHPDAEALILLGDLTHNGLPEEYAELGRILEAIPIPIIPMLGNHDRREAFWAAFPDAPRSTEGFVQHALDIGAHRIITLDSLDGPPYADDHHAGRLCPKRMAFLKDALQDHDGPALVCVHHPPFDTGIRGMDAIKLADGDAFLDCLSDHGRTHLICGHIHKTISGSSRCVPWSVFKSPCHQGVIDFESPNAHLSTDEPGAYGLVLLHGDGVTVHTEDVGLTGVRVFDGYGSDD